MDNDLTKGTVFTSPSGGKDAIRRELLARRAALPEEKARKMGTLAQERLLRDPIWCSARSVALYASARGETATDLLLSDAWSKGKTVLLPRVLPRSQAGAGQMVFARCCGFEELLPGVFGIPEPDARLCPDSKQTPDLLVLPAVGLDRKGFRLGYGGGYYDRHLSREEWRARPRVGLVFELQIVNALPHEAWDIRVDALLSEEALTWL